MAVIISRRFSYCPNFATAPGDVPASCEEMVNAARALVAAAEQQTPQALTRQQRRRLAREQKKTR